MFVTHVGRTSRPPFEHESTIYNIVARVARRHGPAHGARATVVSAGKRSP